MSRTNGLVRRSLTAMLVLAAAACADSKNVLSVPTPTGGAIFARYVAMGNSITAGYQSGGINDSTQRQSYAKLFADQVGTSYAYAALAGPGCPPPIINFQTQGREGGGTSTTCLTRTPASVAPYLNNVAVPGAAVDDPSSVTGTSRSNALTQIILGGESQVQRALDAQPTFLSAWIGNNDVLEAAVSGVLVPMAGVSRGMTPEAPFETAYNTTLSQLTAARPALKGVLFGVVDVTNIPVLFPSAVLANPQFVGGLNQATGKTITVSPDCATANSLVSFQIVPAIASGAHPATIVCTPGLAPAPVGDIFILDTAEQRTVQEGVAAYNTFIASRAAALGWAFVDPNPTLLAARADFSKVKPFPDLSTATDPFGTYFSLDGVHPSKYSQAAIANLMIRAVNDKYGTTVDTIAHNP